MEIDRSAVDTILRNFSQDGVVVTVANVPCNDSRAWLRSDSLNSYDEALDALGITSDLTHIPRELVDPELDGYVDLQVSLNRAAESFCQEKLRALCKAGSGLIDGSSGSVKTFHLPRGMRSNEEGQETTSMISLSGKIDLMSNIGPIFLEIKPREFSFRNKGPNLTNIELQLFSQVLNRLRRLQSSYSQIRTAVGFAATSCFAWCFVLRHETASESLQILRIDHADVFKIWSSVTAKFQSNPVGWMLTEDAPMINSCLMQLGLHPSLCGVVIERKSRKSTHRVYNIFLPQVTSHYNATVANTPAVAILNTTASFCIKVHQESGSYQAEATCINAMISHLRTSEGREITLEKFFACHCLPYLSFESFPKQPVPKLSQFGKISSVSAAILRSLESKNVPILDEILSCGEVWDFFSLPTTLTEFHGGVIVMKCGRSIDELNLSRDLAPLISGVTESLALVHSAGFAHCDIRRMNILSFDSGFQLIDFDMARTLKSGLLFVQGAQYTNRGFRHRDAVLYQQVSWSGGDDFEMFLQFLSSLWPSIPFSLRGE